MKIEIVLGIQGGIEIEEIVGTAIVNEREIGIGTVENTSKSSPLYSIWGSSGRMLMGSDDRRRDRDRSRSPAKRRVL